jgi:Uma2 family endonuclease
MSSPVTPVPIYYPEDDGQPMSDNSVQFEWIQVLSGNLAALFRDRDDVVVGGNLLWYPVQGFPDIRRAPDTFVVFGRPRKRRGSYLQWEENGVPMTVVFEVRSPEDGDDLMQEKLEFYDEYGAEEYYMLDPSPEPNTLQVYVRKGGALGPRRLRAGKFTSPRLGIRFDLTGTIAQVFYPDGQPFRSFEQFAVRADQAEQRTDQAQQRAVQAEQQLDAERQRRARQTELSRKARLGQASAEELAELDRLEADSA